MGTDGSIIEIRDLSKRYGRFVALDRLTLSVGRGQILGFIGPNGAGKTTAIKILVGLARPTGGTATVAGIDCAAEPRRVPPADARKPCSRSEPSPSTSWRELSGATRPMCTLRQQNGACCVSSSRTRARR